MKHLLRVCSLDRRGEARALVDGALGVELGGEVRAADQEGGHARRHQRREGCRRAAPPPARAGARAFGVVVGVAGALSPGFASTAQRVRIRAV